MSVTGAAGTGMSIMTTIIGYFHPSKSPFYGIIAIGTIALALSCNSLDKVSWYFVSIPIYLVLFISLMMAFLNTPSSTHENVPDQLRFARSFSVSSALLCLVLTAMKVDENTTAFILTYVVCLIQIITFLLYTYARSKKEETQTNLNYVQLALITTTFLIGASYCIVHLEQRTVILDKPENYEILRWFMKPEYREAAIGLYLLWSICIIYWINYLRKIIKLSISIPS